MIFTRQQSARKLLPSLYDLPKSEQTTIMFTFNQKDKQLYFSSEVHWRPWPSKDLCCGGPNAGSWLDTLPSAQHLTLTSAHFCTACLMRLGALIPAVRNLEKDDPQCGNLMDRIGYHALACKWGGGPLHGHDNLLDSLYAMLKSLNYRCLKSLQSNLKINSVLTQRFVTTKMGRNCFWMQRTVTHPWPWAKTNNVIYARWYSTKAGFAAKKKEHEKNKYI